ncbi:hypothetical protein F5051DRAFT_447434 [Lentinula edodes]|nr:hypothetical protein F5051DRAFT_447434 [Lentinula edodes]
MSTGAELDPSTYKCSGCSHQFSRASYFIQHLEKTSKPQCMAAHEDLKKTIHRSRFMPQKTPPTYHSPELSKISPSAPLVPPLDTEHDLYVTTPQSVSDFYGHDYSNEDFPGFNEDYNGMGGDIDNDSEDEEQLPPELEDAWELPRVPASSAEHNVDVDAIPTLLTERSLLRDLPSHRDGIHVESFGGQAGAPVKGRNSRNPVLYSSRDGFLQYRSHIPHKGKNPWSPFASQMDWEVAKWAKTRETGLTAFSNLLAVDGVYKALGLSYCNSAELNHIIDTEIPARRPAFTRKEVVIGGEAFDLYKRPIEECIRALYGFPDHVRYLCVSPERHYSDANKTQRLYHDMHTGKWWWNTQVQLEQDKPGATIVPSAYPVYLTIGNLPKEVRRKPSQQAQILLAYLPTTRLQHLPTKAAQRRAVSNLFHACMGSILAPLKSAGIDGIIMTSGDGVRQR